MSRFALGTRELAEVAAYADMGLLREICERCLDGAEARVVAQPEAGLLMGRVVETVDGERFNLGEVLVTNCEVLVGGERGWGMVLGHEPERALCAAVLDAAVREGMADDMVEEISLQLAFVREARRARWAEVQTTRVDFEEMPS